MQTDIGPLKEGDQFVSLVRRMRELQKRYSKEKSLDLLKRCKKIEKQVDIYLGGQTGMNFKYASNSDI